MTIQVFINYSRKTNPTSTSCMFKVHLTSPTIVDLKVISNIFYCAPEFQLKWLFIECRATARHDTRLPWLIVFLRGLLSRVWVKVPVQDLLCWYVIHLDQNPVHLIRIAATVWTIFRYAWKVICIFSQNGHFPFKKSSSLFVFPGRQRVVSVTSY